MAQSKLRVTAAMNPPFLLVDYSRQLRLNGTALVRVEAPSSLKNFAPIDLVALLNVSRTMSEAAALPAEVPLRLDLLKKAMKFVAGHLDEADRLAVVAFDDQVIKGQSSGLLEMSGGGRTAIEKKIDGLVASGDTALRPSLAHAVEILDGRADKSRAGVIILLSDGLDNSKFEWTEESIIPTDVVRPLIQKYPVHTFGLWKAHDSKALHFIAKESSGTYSSITENLECKIMEALAICLAGLKTVVAVNTSVNITSGSLNITRIDSGGYTQRGGSGSIFIGMVYAGEVKDFVVYFDYTTGSWPSGYNRVLSGITACVTYKDVPGRQSTSTETFSVSIPIYTTDTWQAPENPCPSFSALLLQIVRSKVVDLLKSILKELLVLKQEAGVAVQREEGDAQFLHAMAASLLQRKWKEFKQTDGSWKEAPRSFLDLGGIDNDINEMVDILKQGLGVGCMYSWLSSYQMQRATVTGLPGHTDAAGFCTPAMVEMVQEVNKQFAKETEARAQEKGQVVSNQAIELLDMINGRFEMWGKLDSKVPPPFQPMCEQDGDESRKLAAVLYGDISRVRQKDVYLVTDHAIKQWRSSLIAEENRQYLNGLGM